MKLYSAAEASEMAAIWAMVEPGRPTIPPQD